GARGSRVAAVIPSDPSPSAPAGTGGPLRPEVRLLLPPHSTRGGPADRPVAPGGGVLARDDGQLPRIGAAGECGTGRDRGFDSECVLGCRRAAICPPSGVGCGLGSGEFDLT